MIKTLNRLPDVYGEKSRDFQLISRLFDLAFNTSKLSIDTMLNNNGSENIDYRFVDLACRTIGFDYNGSYNTQELIAVIKTFKTLIKNKGTTFAINEAVKLLLNSQGISSSYYIQYPTGTDGKPLKYMIISLPETVKNTKLLDEIFDYILPAGWQYSILLKSVVEFGSGFTSDKIVIDHSIRSIELVDAKTDISNYLEDDGSMKDLEYIGQVPGSDAENTSFTSPVVNFNTVISDPEKIEEV